MGTIPKQNPQQPEEEKFEEEEEFQNSPIKIERNEEEIPNQPAQIDHSSTGEDQTGEQEMAEQETLPINGSIKRGKPRSSTRVTKKPDRWGNNVMITKVEQESVIEEASEPSVIEIPAPKAM